jgi:nucleoside-diphosphate-sugar epimerase
MGALKLFITGATSYLGLATAETALRAGHRLVLHSRFGHRGNWPEVAQVTRVTGALDAPELAAQMAGCDAVLHIAGRMRGSEAEFSRDVVEASRAVMDAARAADVGHVVLAGSVSVYGIDREGMVLTEESPLAPRSDLRDGYTRAKLAQETAMRAAAGDTQLTVLRLGAIWGPGRLWNAHVGVAKGPVLIRIGRDGQIPLCEIDRAGEAMVRAVSADACTLNVLDDDLPDRLRFVAALSASGWPKLVLPLDWRLLDRVARDRASGPGLLRRAVLRARMMPVGWDGARAVAALGLGPQHPFETLMAANIAEGGAP